MKPMLAVRAILKDKGLRRNEYAFRLGIRPGTLKERLKQQNVGCALLCSMLRAMDYKVVLIPSSERIRDGWYELD